MEWNASTQVTLWSSPEIAEFHDYANKQWAGLMKGYYYKRWEMFTEVMLNSLETGKEFDPQTFRKQILDWEAKWSFAKHDYPVKPAGDPIEVTLKLFEKIHLPDNGYK